MRVRSLGQEDPLEEETHSSILAWRIPWTEEQFISVYVCQEREGAHMYRERKLSNNYLHNEYRIFKSNKNQVIKRNKNNHGIHKCQTIRKNHILLKINMDLTFFEFF